MPVTIRPPTLRDGPAFLAAVQRSRALHRRWVSPPDTHKQFEAYAKRMTSDPHRGFLVVLRSSGDLVGAIHLNHIVRGSLQGAFLGYYAFTPNAGQGLMREGMRLVLRHAFHKLKLHRLEANIQPDNRASLRLARSCGFVREGFSRRYLRSTDAGRIMNAGPSSPKTRREFHSYKFDAILKSLAIIPATSLP